MNETQHLNVDQFPLFCYRGVAVHQTYDATNHHIRPEVILKRQSQPDITIFVDVEKDLSQAVAQITSEINRLIVSSIS